MQLREVLSYELATVQYSLAHVDGSLRKATKSVLLAELEKCVQVLPRLPVQDYILDGLAIVQMMKAGGAQSFGELAEKGPIRTSKKVVYLDKFSVIASASLMRMVCRGPTNFVRSGQIFKRTADKICPG